MAIAKEERTEVAEPELIGESLLESVAEETELLEATGDGSVSVTLIKPGWSKNGNYYSRQTLEQAASLFEGSLSFVNHPTRTEARERPNRDVRDLAGLYEGVHIASDGSLRGNLRLIGKNGADLKPLISEAIKLPELIGISINAAGNLREGVAEGRRGKIVENIVNVVSSDIVTRPAAGGKFDRLVAAEDWVEKIIEEISFEQWQTHHQDWKPKEVSMEDIREQVNPLIEEAVKPFREQLEAQSRELAEGKRRESARIKLEASAVPTAVRADLLESVAALEEDDQQPFIDRQVEMFRKLNIRPTVTGAGQGANVAEPEKLTEDLNSKLFGVSVPAVKRGESVWDYQARTRQG